MVAVRGEKEIGDRINKIIGRLADANDSLTGAINVADFNDEEKFGKGNEMKSSSELAASSNNVASGRLSTALSIDTK